MRYHQRTVHIFTLLSLFFSLITPTGWALDPVRQKYFKTDCSRIHPVLQKSWKTAGGSIRQSISSKKIKQNFKPAEILKPNPQPAAKPVKVDKYVKDTIGNFFKNMAEKIIAKGLAGIEDLKNMSSSLKEKLIDYFIGLKDDLTGWAKAFLMQAMGVIAADNNVSQRSKEKMVDTLLSVINSDLMEYGQSHAAFALLKITANPSFDLSRQSRILTTILTAYTRGIIKDNGGFLGVVAEIGRKSPGLKAAISFSLGLNETQKKIWNEFGILAVDSEERSFSKTELNTLYNILSVLPADVRCGIKVFLSTTPKKGYNAFMEATPPGVIWIHFDDKKFGKDNYIKAILHEIGHEIDFHSLPADLKQLFTLLNINSGNNRDNYVSDYAMTNRNEDFAETFAFYMRDTAAAIEQAGNLSGGKRNILMKKLKVISKLFSFTGKDGKTYTYIFKLNNDGTLTKSKVRLGQNGLPVLKQRPKLKQAWD